MEPGLSISYDFGAAYQCIWHPTAGGLRINASTNLDSFLEEKNNAKLDIEQRIGQRRQKISFSFPNS